MNVLLTKKLAQDQLDLIHSWGWNCETVETLRITSVDVPTAPTHGEAWVVSSRNSFEVIQKFITIAPKRIFCVGHWMKKEIAQLTAKTSATSFENMSSLATELAKENFREIVYFCGREHRNELEKSLSSTATKITKVITHESEMIFPVIKKPFDAVFVFSPRSVESLLKHNYFPQTVFACIGPTTAQYLHDRGITKTFTASYPESQKLLKEFYKHLQL